MHTLILDNVPASLYHRIEHLATARRQSPADTALAMLESAIRDPTMTLAEAPLPQEPFLTEEISAPCSIPRPKGEPIVLVEIMDYVPLPHDLPEGE